MKKLGAFVLITLFLALSFAYAADEGVDKAYSCLENEVSNKSSESFSLEEAVFSTLALGSEKKFTDKIESEKANQNCWPKSSCTIKDTSQVFLAYDRINKNTNDIKNYLLIKNSSSTELNWFLQIDIQDHISSNCNVKYDGQDHSVSVNEDMTLSSGAGSCLPLSSNGYWLQVRDSCYGKTFQVSCDQEFITSLLYQKTGSSTIYVSSETHSAASSGTTEEEVNSQCFKTGSSCDYEGTLWATIALKNEIEVNSFLPYLIALASDNQKFFPGTFIFMLTAGDDQFNEIEKNFKTEGFWQAPNTKYNKFYDTSLALLALQSSASPNVELSKTYLLSIQTPDGCWNNNNIRDTSFLLYSGWPKGVSGSGGSSNGSSGGGDICASPQGYCGSQFDCQPSGGQLLANLKCPTFGQSCCSVQVIEQTCLEKSGAVCKANEFCSGTSVSSIEGSCCLGTCQPRAITEESQCESLGGFCATSCTSGEQQTSDSCNDAALICCTLSSAGSGVSLWITILVILIILVILAIVFRKKLQIAWFNFKNRGRKDPPSGPSRPSSPPFSPRGPPRPAFTGTAQRQPQRQPLRRPSSKLDQEMEETLKKLREMSS